MTVPVQVKMTVQQKSETYAMDSLSNNQVFSLQTNEAVGGTGTNDYEKLKNKPSINSVELIGNKEFEDLGMTPITNQMIESLF